MKTKYGIFTKQIHVPKLVNFLNQETDIDYIIGTEKTAPYAHKFDIGVSYCWPHIINVDWTGGENKRIWYNYHPGPLPGYEGPYEYAKALAKGDKTFGVTLHKMTMELDKGPIVKVNRFKLKSEPSDINELGNIAHYHLMQLFKETVEHLPKYDKEN